MPRGRAQTKFHLAGPTLKSLVTLETVIDTLGTGVQKFNVLLGQKEWNCEDAVTFAAKTIAVLCALGAVLHGAYVFCNILPLALFSNVFTSHV